MTQQMLHLCLGYKIRPLIDYFNAAFGEALYPDSEQSIDEHMTKFKEKCSCKQYLQLKASDRGLNGGADVLAVATCMKHICILGRNKKQNTILVKV